MGVSIGSGFRVLDVSLKKGSLMELYRLGSKGFCRFRV